MNERIKEFRFKAAEYANEQKPLGLMKWNELRDAKFAELIVGECLDIVANADMTELEGPDPEDVLYVACKQIKAHFGVEE